MTELSSVKGITKADFELYKSKEEPLEQLDHIMPEAKLETIEQNYQLLANKWGN